MPAFSVCQVKSVSRKLYLAGQRRIRVYFKTKPNGNPALRPSISVVPTPANGSQTVIRFFEEENNSIKNPSTKDGEAGIQGTHL